LVKPLVQPKDFNIHRGAHDMHKALRAAINVETKDP